MKLGTLLLRNATIGLTQLESALRNQVLYGGRLGTNLVELGILDLEILSAYLAELTGFPVATSTLLDDALPALLEKLGSDEAHRLRAIPFDYLGGRRSDVAVAMVDPTDQAALGQLSAKLGAKVMPYVVPELRALYYLEKLFGLPRRARFVRTARPGSEGEVPQADERRRSQPAAGMVMPPAFTLQPRARRASQAPSTTAVPTVLLYGAACERIDTATDRDQIADAFIDYAKGRCDALVLFLIRDGNALGWRAWVAPPLAVKQAIEELSLPLGGASALQAAHDASQPYVGPPLSTARPVETALWKALGTAPEPTTVIVVPVLVKTRAVNLIYVHALTGPPPASLVTELTDLAARAQTAYMRLIRQARGEL